MTYRVHNPNMPGTVFVTENKVRGEVLVRNELIRQGRIAKAKEEGDRIRALAQASQARYDPPEWLIPDEALQVAQKAAEARLRIFMGLESDAA